MQSQYLGGVILMMYSSFNSHGEQELYEFVSYLNNEKPTIKFTTEKEENH